MIIAIVVVVDVNDDLVPDQNVLMILMGPLWSLKQQQCRNFDDAF